jgi:hypothetical protein
MMVRDCRAASSGLLPPEQSQDCITLWEELQTAEFADAQFAKSWIGRSRSWVTMKWYLGPPSVPEHQI